MDTVQSRYLPSVLSIDYVPMQCVRACVRASVCVCVCVCVWWGGGGGGGGGGTGFRTGCLKPALVSEQAVCSPHWFQNRLFAARTGFRTGCLQPALVSGSSLWCCRFADDTGRGAEQELQSAERPRPHAEHRTPSYRVAMSGCTPGHTTGTTATRTCTTSPGPGGLQGC